MYICVHLTLFVKESQFHALLGSSNSASTEAINISLVEVRASAQLLLKNNCFLMFHIVSYCFSPYNGLNGMQIASMDHWLGKAYHKKNTEQYEHDRKEGKNAA